MTVEAQALTDRSRTRFIMELGPQTRTLIVRCDDYAAALSDRAESEKSAPLRLCLHSMSARIEDLSNELRDILGQS